MERSPLYQGHQYRPAQAPQAHLSPEIPFGQQYVNNLGETTKSLQRLHDALVERNDNTILLNQQANEKQAALDLTNELRALQDMPDGAEGGLYDQYGRVRKDVVNNLRNKYLARARSWHKGLIDPASSEKSALATQEYTAGVNQTIEAALLANTKTRQRKAYMRNMELNQSYNAYDDNDKLIDDAYANKVIDATEAEQLKFDNEKAKLGHTIDSTNDADALLDMWENPATQEQLSYHPALRDALERKIKRINQTQGQAENAESFTTSKSGKGTGTAGSTTRKPKTSPPDGSPLYIKALYAKYNGDFPKNSTDAFRAIQTYLSEQVDKLNDTDEGAEQWVKARALANAIGIEDTEFNKAYENRTRQLSPGDVDPQKMLAAIPIHNWLNATVMDDVEIDAFEDELIVKAKKDKENLTKEAVDDLLNARSTEQKREQIKKDVAEALRKEVIAEYNLWSMQNGDKADTRQKYTKLLEITNRLEKDLENKGISDFIRKQLIAAEAAVTREKMATADRRSKRAKLESYYKSVNLGGLFKTATAMPTISTDVQFDYKLGAPNSKLPDSKTHNIIYLPENSEQPKQKKVNVIKRKGSLACTIEFRTSKDVEVPTPSRKLLRTLDRATLPPNAIKWDGNDLILGDALVDDYSAYYADNDILPPYDSNEKIYIDKHGHVHRPRGEGPDDGLSDEHYTEEETYTDSDGEVYHPLPL